MTNWPVEPVPVWAILYRAVPRNMHLDRLNMHDPQPAAFECKPDENGASVYWSKYAQEAEQVYMHVGLCGTYKDKNVLKNWREYQAWGINWSKLSMFTTVIEGVLHDPTNQSIPFPRGIPGNRSHSLIGYRIKGKLSTAYRGLIADCIGDRMEQVEVQEKIDNFDGHPFI